MPPGSEDEEELKEQVKKLNKRIAELEGMLEELQEPFRKLYGAAQGYYKFIDLYMKYGEVSPELTVPELKDPISKDIIVVLFEKNGQNTSQITEAVKVKRGSASRRIIREKLAKLEEEGYVTSEQTKKATLYYISEELTRKWSEVLGFSK
jgi:predicted transcriptional regulator